MESSSFMEVEQETPSPAPAPGLVQAEKVSKYNSSCTLVNGILKIKVVDNTTNVLYIKQIDYNSSFWSEYGKYFQNDIKKLYDILQLCFNGNYQDITLGSGMDWSYEIDTNDVIKLQLYYEGIFGFNICIKIPKENTEVDKLKNVITELKKELEILKADHTILQNNYDKRLNTIEKWLEIRLKPITDV